MERIVKTTMLWLQLVVLVWTSIVSATTPNSDSVPFNPVVIPLAVRSPYLGAYLQGSEHKNLAKQSPGFWTGSPLGWQGLLRVDGHVYGWMGNVSDWLPANNESITYTSTTSTFNMTDGPRTVSLTASFLSPITPSDLFRQSIPFSYLSLSVESLDGKDHDVEVYTDVDGLWLADDEDEQLEWKAEAHEGWTGINYQLKEQRVLREEEWTDHSLWGDLWYAARATAASIETTFSAGYDAKKTRHYFARHGSLANSTQPNFRSTRTRDRANRTEIIDEPVFAFSHAFKIRAGSSRDDNTALLTIGLTRDPIVRYKVAGPDTVNLRPLWTAAFKTLPDLITFFLKDFEYERDMSDHWNRQLFADARSVHGEEYANILAISTRQIFAALEGVADYSNNSLASMTTIVPTTGERVPTFFMLKEVSSNGNCQTIDVIAPFLPFLLYACPDLLPMLLEPTLRYAQTGLFVPSNLAVVHDLGDHYPNAIGHDEYKLPTLELENTGNMLLLVLAGIRRGTPSALEQARKYWDLLGNWSSVLSRTAIWPSDQSSTDDFFGPSPNQTSLTIKGIMGVRAGSDIARELGTEKDAVTFKKESVKMLEHFMKNGISQDRTHILSHYGDESGWHSQYNLYYDKLLGTRVFSESIYEMQDDFYPMVTNEFGPDLDSGMPNRAKTDWLGWLAACSPVGSATRDLFITALSRYHRQLKNDVYGDFITTEGGWSVGYLTRPVVGGHFALLGLEVMEQIRAGEKVVGYHAPAFSTISAPPSGWTTHLEDVKEWTSAVTAGVAEVYSGGLGWQALLGAGFLLGLSFGLVVYCVLSRRGANDSQKGKYQPVLPEPDCISPTRVCFARKEAVALPMYSPRI